MHSQPTIPPGRSTNFSRPLPSPNPTISCFSISSPYDTKVTVPRILEDGREDGLVICESAVPITHLQPSTCVLAKMMPSDETPTRLPRDRTRPVLGQLSSSSSHHNAKQSAISESTEASAVTAANRLIDFTRGTPPSALHTRILSASHHKRRFSKARKLSQDENNDSEPIVTALHTDLGGRARPIMHFRPNLWRHLDRDRSTLNLDLFWPLKEDQCTLSEPTVDALARPASGHSDLPTQSVPAEQLEDTEEEESDMFPLEDMKALCEFRHLRSLQIGGMLQSYQKYIWQTCWLNPGLEELTLEMALEPTISDSYSHLCPRIEGEWKIMNEKDGSAHYLGQHGEGTLSSEYGIGEYLDKEAIAMAKFDAAPKGGRLRYLPVVKLALSGFVLDSGAMKWFDPLRLRQIELRHSCVDAGFAVPGNMTALVKVSWPEEDKSRTVKMTTITREDVQLLTLKKGKLVADSIGLKPKITSLLSHRWFSTNKRKGELKDGRGGSRLSSSNSTSSLRQRSSSARSRKSQEVVDV